MSIRKRRLTQLLLITSVAISLWCEIYAQTKTAQAPMAQVARDYAWRPYRADVVPQTQGVKAGDPIAVQVTLLDANGKLTNAIQPTTLILETQSPSRNTLSIKVEIPAGSSSAEVKLPALEPGLIKLTIRHPDNLLVGSSNFVFVAKPGTAAKGSKKSKKTRVPKPTVKPTSYFRWQTAGTARLQTASLTFFDFQPDDLAGGPGAPSSGPQIMLQVSGENDSNVRADPATYERVDVYYMDAEPASRPIQIWLSWDHGEIKPNPIIINPGERFGEAQWTSDWPAKGATVSIADVKPPIAISGSRQKTINFVDPIFSVGFLDPPKTMTIVDQYNLHAHFFDRMGKLVRTSDKRKVTISASNPILRFSPDTQETDWDFQTSLVPTGWGKAEITVATDKYPPFTTTVAVTYVGIMLLCIAGGILGSLADILTNPKAPHGWRILARMMVGTLAALLACWAYVIVGLPNAPPGILHSRIAVGGVSLVAGWAGIAVFRRVAKVLSIEI
jgi:hypothetical protein